MSGKALWSLVAVSVLALTAGQTQASSYDRVAYYDAAGGVAWAGGGAVTVRDALQQAGYRIVNAAELKTWMDGHIADKKLSVVVMCQDVVPTTVAETMTPTCTIRRYLDAGGKVVWFSDWPFYYAGTTGTTWGSNGASQVLGFNASTGPNDTYQTVTITDLGRLWGLTTPWTSRRPTSPTVTPNLDVLAKDNNGNAAGWVKHYVPGDTYRGFVRIDDHDGAPVNIAQLIAVAEYCVTLTTASGPVPSDGATDVPRDATLRWTAGEYPSTHDVYFGTTFADANTASRTNAKGVLASKGQADTTFDPPGSLAYGQTYYWRVDEVNKAPDSTIFKGNVWSFTAEPYGYPVKPVKATASSSQPGMGPEKTLDGSGLTGDLHGTEATTMWMSAGVPPNWIQYEFDKAYKLYQLQVWNSNQPVETYIGFGAKKVTIETSTDGTTWKSLADAPEFSKGSGLPDYAANTTVNFGGVEAKFVKLTITANWGGVAPQTGLAEVRFLYVPVQARVPQPANAATGVALDATLNWRPGREAGSHKVFLGTDQAAVAGGTAAAQTVTDHSFAPGALNLAATYYWRVDEVNTVTYPGSVWSFITQQYKVVDDFESYTDKAGAEVFSTWIDGYADNYKSSGSTVGKDQAVNGTFCETTIIHGGRQSMPLAYDNSKAPNFSEAVRTFDTPQDWTASGIKSLSLWFQGVAGNGGQLYVKINSTKVLYDGDATDLARAVWQPWNIDLSKAGKVNSVRSLTIGIEGAGTKGTLYIDDIRLYPKVPEYITPVQPAATSLVAYYTFDEGSGTTVKDSSGVGNNGAFGGAPKWVAGTKGGALQLNGSTDYVVIDSVAKSMPANNNFTVSAWIKTTTTTQGYVIASNDSASAHDFTFGTATNGNLFVQANTASNYPPKINDDKWHLITYVRDGTTAYLYTDGLLVGTETPSGNPATQVRWSIGQEWDGATGPASDFYNGAVDDVRFYARPLSAGEVAGLAGLTKTMPKPF